MLKPIQTVILMGVLAAKLFSQAPERFVLPNPFPPDIIPPGVLADRDPVRVDPEHFRVDFQNDRVRVVRLTMKGGESSPMHEAPEILAVCLSECHLRLTRPNGKTQDLHMQAGDTQWLWQDSRSEKNLGTKLLEMVLIEIKAKRPSAN